MALFRITFLFSLASVIFCAPIDQTKTNANGTSVVQIPKQNDVAVQPATTVLLPLTATSANLAGNTNVQPTNAAIIQAGPMGRSDADYNAEGRDLTEALGLMSTFLTPKLMQPGAASASMTPASSGPQAASVQQQPQQMVPQQQAGFQQPIGFGQQQPGAFQQPMVNNQFPQQQGFLNQQQPGFVNQVPLQQNVDPRMLAFPQPAFGQGAYQQPSAVFNQPMPFLQTRALNNVPQQVQNANVAQQLQLSQAGNFNGMPVQNTIPVFNNNNPQFVPNNQQFPNRGTVQG